MKLRLTKQADADIATILTATRKLFGKNQVLVYAGIIEQGMNLIAQAPSHARCRTHDDLALGVKSVHLDHVKGKRNSASHLIFFMETNAAEQEKELVIIAVLHEKMLPRRHLAKALRDI